MKEDPDGKKPGIFFFCVRLPKVRTNKERKKIGPGTGKGGKVYIHGIKAYKPK